MRFSRVAAAYCDRMFETQIIADPPPGSEAVKENEVHVWRIALDWRSEDLLALRQVLSADERERMDRFYFEADRRRYLIGRGILRTLLGRRLDISPDKVRFDYSTFAKPAPAADLAHSRLQFSVSHSGELVLIALADGRAVGIDVERIRTDIAVGKIAARFFSPGERDALAEFAADRQHDAFFACWTRKEAYMKARGDGLHLPLDAFDVEFLPGRAARLLETRHDPDDAQRWTLHELDVGEGYKAALAVEGEGTPKCWQWPAGLSYSTSPPST
jgi:4'-phosphopantetheinyl transferase